MNRIDELFGRKRSNILSVFYTAGFPDRTSTLQTAAALEQAGADMIEIGMPYSDPLADGPVIQHSSAVALKNGMTISLLFAQLKYFRKYCHLPALLMGYLNPIIQFGFKKFCEKCRACGIDGIIIPDIPLDDLEQKQSLFKESGLHCILLITPQTPTERIKRIDALSSGFIYMVSSASTTGRSTGFSKEQVAYFKKIKEMELKNPVLMGFGIHDRQTFNEVCKYSSGAIVGSYFIKLLEKNESKTAANQLIKTLIT